MSFQKDQFEFIDYEWCQYKGCRRQFRGPACDVSKPYIAYLGGTETFGRYMKLPFPDIVSVRTGLGRLNLSAINSGLDFYLSSDKMIEMVNHARSAVIELPGAAHQSNPFFSVHPRRNDRVIRVSDALIDLFPNVDFVDIHFIRHLMVTLSTADHVAFQVVCDALRSTWQAKIAALLSKIQIPVHLICLKLEGGPDPWLIDDRLLATVGAHVDVFIRSEHEGGVGTDARAFVETPTLTAAPFMLGRQMHEKVAHHLTNVILNTQQKSPPRLAGLSSSI